MGTALERDRFEEREFAEFAERLERSLEVFATAVERPGFGVGPRTIGAEVEGSLVDAEGRVAPLSTTVQEALDDPRVVSELNRFNIEANLGVRAAGGRALSALEAELVDVQHRLDAAAARAGGRLALCGIVPSIRAMDLSPAAVTDEPRYRALENGLDRLRGTPINVRIDGPEPITMEAHTVAVEGASTSWQLHLRAEPAAYSDVFNAARLATVVALAPAVNAPFYCGHRLWQETRVALFKQAVDHRARGLPPFSRVGFGDEWVTGGVVELVEHAVRHHQPIIPLCADVDPEEAFVDGGAPDLAELRLHLGTVWSWNRPVYDPVDGGHLRVEMRALPSGPTARDMVANAAFLLGLTLSFVDSVAEVAKAFPFNELTRGFHAVARHGLDAELDWPDGGHGPRRVRARDLAEALLPEAQRGLVDAGFHPGDVDQRLGVVAERIRTGRTGAAWTTARAATHEERYDRSESLRRTTQDYVRNSAEGAPVATWD